MKSPQTHHDLPPQKQPKIAKPPAKTRFITANIFSTETQSHILGR